MLKKKTLVFTLLALLAFISSIAIAEDIKIFSPESTVIIHAGETNEVNIPIKNEGNQRDTVYITIWPTQWVRLEKYWVTVDPDETKKIPVFITPPEDAEEGTIVFSITTRSLNTNRTSTDSLFLTVKRKANLFISEIKLDKESVDPGQSLGIESVITNLHKTQSSRVYLTTKILTDGSTIKKFEETVDLNPKSVKIIKTFYDVNDLQEYGTYFVEVELKDNLNNLLDKERDNFEINKKFKISKHETRDYGFFYTATAIEVTNTGNVPDSEYTVEESLPQITKYFFYPETEPDTEQEKENRIIYTWKIKDLDPGQTKIIRYKLRFINVFITFLTLTLLVILVYEYLSKPMLKKKFLGVLSGEEELKITLHVKNRRGGTIKDVIVKDTVPPIAKVIRKFDTRKPEINVKSSGTELKWHIEKLKSGEEIVLTYKIKPLIDVIGKLKLPKSYLTYKGKVTRNRRVVSKSISITGKVK